MKMVVMIIIVLIIEFKLTAFIFIMTKIFNDVDGKNIRVRPQILRKLHNSPVC